MRSCSRVKFLLFTDGRLGSICTIQFCYTIVLYNYVYSVGFGRTKVSSVFVGLKIGSMTGEVLIHVWILPCSIKHSKQTSRIKDCMLDAIQGVQFTNCVSFQKLEVFDLFSSILYECVTQENPEMLPAYIAIDQVK